MTGSLDEKDMEILRLLQQDGRRSVREISRKLACPATTVYARINRLEKEGFIESYKAVLDPRRLNRSVTAFVLASFTYRSPGNDKVLSQREIARRVSEFGEVQEVHIISGDWDILIKIKERDVESVGSFVIDKLRTVKGIEKTLTCLVFDSAKETMDLNI